MSIKTSRKTSNPQVFRKTLNSTKNKPKFAGKPQGWQHWSIHTRDDQIADFTIRSYPVFEKWYPYPIRILFWLKSYYPYPKTVRKCIAMHNIHFCALSILPHEAK